MTGRLLRAGEPVPVGFGVVFDPSTVELEPGVWLGGQPLRVLRVIDHGAVAWAELAAGPVATRAGGLLARRLVDAGLAHPAPPPAAAALSVTVVIPTRDRADALDRCLSALGRAYPVVVVDDGSTDAAGVRRVADRHGARLVRLPRNLGPAAARNAGLAAVGTDLVAFLDSDTVPGREWIGRLAAHLADPLVAAVAPRISPLTGAGWAGRYTAARSPLDLGTRPASVRPYTRVSYVPTAALLVRRAALTAVAGTDGPFDPGLRVGEDVDLIWRLLAAGWRIRYQPETTVGHDEPRGWLRLLARRYRYGTSTAWLSRKHPANTVPFVVHPWFTATAAGILTGRPAAAAGALTGALLSGRRGVRRAGLPPRRVFAATADGVRQTWLGLGRYGTRFAAPALLAAAVSARPSRRLAAASLLLGPALAGWLASDRRLDPVRYGAASIADDTAYGAGVLAGCLRLHTLRPLIPRSTNRRQRW